MNKHIFRIRSIILSGVLLFMVGCTIESSDENNNINIIEIVLTNTFTGPNEELAKTYKEVASDDLDVAESAFDHQEALRHDIQMKVEEISVEQNENADASNC